MNKGCRLSNTQLLANPSSGRLLLSQQSTTPIQTELSTEGVKNRTENSLILISFFFNLNYTVRGFQRTVQKIGSS